MIKSPRVTVVLGVKDDRGALRTSVNSVLSQSVMDLELIIVLDGSNTSTRLTVSEIASADDRVRAIELSENVGLTAALNVGLDQVRSELVARIDEGDTWYRHKLGSQLALMDEGIVLVGCQAVVQTAQGARMLRRPTRDTAIRRSLVAGVNPFFHSAVLFRKFSDVRYNERLRYSQDFELWMRYSLLGSMVSHASALMTYPVSTDSLTALKPRRSLTIRSAAHAAYLRVLRVRRPPVVERYVRGEYDLEIASAPRPKASPRLLYLAGYASSPVERLLARLRRALHPSDIVSASIRRIRALMIVARKQHLAMALARRRSLPDD